MGASILKMWNIAWDLWEHCNGVEHDHDVSNLQIELNEKIRQEIENFRESDHPDIFYMFRATEIDCIYDSTIGYKRAWLRNVTNANAKGVRRNKSPEMHQMRHTMRRFLNMAIARE